MPARSKRAPSTVRLQPADAFDLIRWLARSQSDPRKAVAELVQNAIDANARTTIIERRRRGRRAALVVRDDGHADYRALSTEPRARLRYMVALFAKDVTVATTHAANEPMLDQMIDVLALAERNLLRPIR